MGGKKFAPHIAFMPWWYWRGGSDHIGCLPFVLGYGRKTTIPWVLSISTKGLVICMRAIGSVNYDLKVGGERNRRWAIACDLRDQTVNL